MKLPNTLLVVLGYVLQVSFCVGQTQNATQIVKGQIIDRETFQPISGVLVFVENTNPIISTRSDNEGIFYLNNVPTGRQTLKAERRGYTTYFTDNLNVRVSNETYIQLAMQSSIAFKNNAAQPDIRENRAVNESSLTSTRSFSAEETTRYAGAIDDPGRMALGFAGIQSFRGSENDVIIRGNFSNRTLWQLEGMDVRSPNQIVRAGDGGGGIAILNASLLDYSDLTVGGFAAEYSNVGGGVWNLNLKKGNRNSREHTAWIDLYNMGIASNGFIKKGRSSYVVKYRYSTLGLLGLAGIHLIRDNVQLTFQDLSFNLDFNSKNNKSKLIIFGMGGLGDGSWSIKKDTTDWITRLDYTDVLLRTKMGILGAKYTKLLDERSYFNIIIGGSGRQFVDDQSDALLKDTARVLTNEFVNVDYNLAVNYSNRVDNLYRIKAGIKIKGMLYDLKYQEYDFQQPQLGLQTYIDQRNFGEFYKTFLLQAYAQSTIKLGRRVQSNVGISGMFFTLNNTYSIEPRLGIRYRITAKTTANLTYALHGRILPLGTYLIRQTDTSGNIYLPNKDLDIPQTHDIILGLRQIVGQDLTLQLEGYYQHTFKAPISKDPDYTFWLFNYRDLYGKTAMVSNSIGKNYGLELTVEKSFRKGYYLLLTGALFRSIYITPSGEVRRASADNKYITSLATGKEFYFRKNMSLQLGFRLMIRGGMLYIKANEQASVALGNLILDNKQLFTEQAKTYVRLDSRIAFRKEGRNHSFLIEAAIQNTTLQENLLGLEYNRKTKQLRNRYNPRIIPVIRAQVYF